MRTVLFSTALLACSGLHAQQLAERTADPHRASVYQPALLDVVLNGELVQSAAPALHTRDGAILLSGSSLRKLGLQLPLQPAVQQRGEAYYLMSQFPGLRHQLDAGTQALLIELAADELPRHAINLHERQWRAGETASPAGEGGLLFNYDLMAEKRFDGRTRHNASLDAAMFTERGIAYTAFSNLGAGHGYRQSLVRLDSYWQQDDPERLMTLRLGDAQTQINNWGAPVRFAGMQWGSNPSLRPGFIPFALPSFSAHALTNADARIYVNNQYQSGMRLPFGNLQLNDIPVTTGAGEIRAVVRDAFGREQVYVQPYYVSPSLLRAGRHEYQLSLGAERRNYGLESNDYGSLIAVLDHRYGVSSKTSTGARIEARHDQQTAGLNLTQLLPIGVVASATAAFSRSDEGNGHMSLLGLERTTARAGFSIAHQMSSDGFRQLGMDAWRTPERQRTLARFHISPTGADALQLNLHQRRYVDGRTSRFSGLTYAFSSSPTLHWTLYANRDFGETRSYAIGISLNIMLGERRNASLSWSKLDNDATQAVATVQKSLPLGSGFGYRASVGQFADTKNGNFTVMAQNRAQTYEAGFSQYGDERAYTFGVRGGLVVLGGHLMPTRYTEGSFGLVKIGDHADIRVMHENNLVATTDARGLAIVPNLRAYEINRIRFEENDLPLNVSISNPEMTVVPRYRSGTMVVFPVKTERIAKLTLRHPDGTPLPGGTEVRIEGRPDRLPVFLRGETFVPDAMGLLRGYALHNGRRCEFSLTVPAGAGPVFVAPPIECQGTSP